MVLKAFHRWWTHASPAQKRKLAARADSSYQALAHVAHGVRDLSPERAARIERATGGEMTRGDLCATCRSCPYWRRRNK